MPPTRNRRLPISCEPCRIRKIRCSRDSTPCGTCIRRSVLPEQCRYACKTSLNDAIAEQSSAKDTQSSEISNAALLERVQRLEELLRVQTAAYSVPTPNASALQTSQSAVTENELARRSQHRPRQKSFSGILRTTESGYVRFIPSSLDMETKLTLAEPPSSGHQDLISRNYPLDDIARQTFRELLTLLPPTNHCAELVRIYFSSFASLFHILHDPTFYQQYDSFLQDPHSMPLAWLALLFAIVSTAVLGLSSKSRVLNELSRSSGGLTKMFELSERYRTLALRCLEADHYLWDHNVTTLQTLVLLIYSISHSHGQAWTLLGLAHHIALSIGCHVDPSDFGLDVIECEERRRAWAGLQMLYVVQNTAMGCIGSAHALLSVSCRPPADINDDDLVPGQMELPQAQSPAQATQMTYLLLKFRLYDICAEVCDKVLHVNNGDHNPISILDARIQQEESIREQYYFGHTQAASLAAHHLAHVNILNGYSNHLLLLLHHNNALDKSVSPDSRKISRHRCLDSAKILLEIHAYLQESQELAPFQWYNRGLGSFHAFHAAVILIALYHENMTDVRDLLQQCLERFRTMAELSPLCEKAAPLLQQILRRVESQGPGRTETGPHFESPPSRRRDDDQWLARQLHTPPSLMGNSIGSSENAYADCTDWDSIWSEFQAQQWLTSTELPWEQWNSIISNSTTP